MRRLVATIGAMAIACAAWAELTPTQVDALRAVARGESPEWSAADSKQLRALQQKADAYLGNFRQYHLPNGLAVDILWQDDARTTVLAYEGVGDSARRQGYYLAVLALKYAVAPDDETHAELMNALHGFDLLTTISGRDGYLARCAGPAADEFYRAVYSTYPRGEDSQRIGLGKRAYKGVLPRDGFVWLGDSSPDLYDGAAVGLAAALKYADDPEVQARTRNLIRRMAKRLAEDDWNIVDGEGHKTLTAISWRLVWMRLAMSASPAEYQHLDREYEALYAKLMERKDDLRPVGKQTEAYASNILDLDRDFVLCALEPNLERLRGYKGLVREAFRQAADHLNAHLAAVYALATGDTQDPRAQATLQGMLIDFAEPPNRLHLVDNRSGEVHGMKDARMAKEALLAHERPATDYLWSQAPCLAAGGEEKNLEFPGLDFLLPYWMARRAGAL